MVRVVTPGRWIVLAAATALCAAGLPHLGVRPLQGWGTGGSQGVGICPFSGASVDRVVRLDFLPWRTRVDGLSDPLWLGDSGRCKLELFYEAEQWAYLTRLYGDREETRAHPVHSFTLRCSSSRRTVGDGQESSTLLIQGCGVAETLVFDGASLLVDGVGPIAAVRAEVTTDAAPAGIWFDLDASAMERYLSP